MEKTITLIVQIEIVSNTRGIGIYSKVEETKTPQYNLKVSLLQEQGQIELTT